MINCYLKLYTKFCKKRSSIFTKFNHSSLKLQNIFILSSVSLKPDSLNKVSRNNGLNCLNSIYFRFVYRPNYSHFFYTLPNSIVPINAYTISDIFCIANYTISHIFCIFNYTISDIFCIANYTISHIFCISNYTTSRANNSFFELRGEKNWKKERNCQTKIEKIHFSFNSFLILEQCKIRIKIGKIKITL